MEPDIRFSLANERTFLSWLRTSIGLVAAGVGVHHLLEPSDSTTVLSLVLLAGAAIASVIGFVHYRQADAAIRQGESLRSSSTVLGVMTVAAIVATVAGVTSIVLG